MKDLEICLQKWGFKKSLLFKIKNLNEDIEYFLDERVLAEIFPTADIANRIKFRFIIKALIRKKSKEDLKKKQELVLQWVKKHKKYFPNNGC